MGKALGLAMTFNPNLHPRAAGGKFGTANNPKAQAQGGTAAQVKSQLLNRANNDDKRIAQLQQQERQLRAQLAGMKAAVPKSHTVAKKSASKTPKGSKSGVAAKTKAAKSGTAAKSKTTSAAKAPKTAAQIRSQLIIVTGMIHALQQDAKNCRQAAANL